MASQSPDLVNKTISVDVSKASHYEEGKAATELYPGMVAFLGVGGEYWKANTSTIFYYLPIFVVENPYEGKSITDSYAISEHVMMRVARRGDLILTKITSMAAPILDPGTRLATSDTGFLRDWVIGDQHPVAESMEEDLSPSFPRWTTVRII